MRQFYLYNNIIVFVCIIQGIPVYGKTGGGITPDATEEPTASPIPDASATSVPVPVSLPSPMAETTLIPSSPLPTTSSEPTKFEIFTPSPNSEDCRSTTNGVYGRIDGESLVVSFSYAVELTDGTSESEFTSILLPDLEIAMNDAIIPTVFPECSTTTNTTRRRRLLSSLKHRQLVETIVGISTRPIDSIEADVECSGNNCFGLFGTLTIFLQDETSTRRRRTLQETESHATIIRRILKENMDMGAFNNVAESITNVTWVDDGQDGNEIQRPPPDNGGGSSNNQSRSGETIGWTVAVGAAALFVVLAAVAMRRRRQRNENNEDQSIIEGNSTINSAI